MRRPCNNMCIISLVILTIFVSNLRPVNGNEACTRLSPCKCVFDNGQMIDLSPLGRLDGLPRFNETSSGENTFMWNPCFSFTFNTQCQDVALCEIHPSLPKDEVFAIGYQNSAVFKDVKGADDVQLQYTTKDHNATLVRTAFISLECTQNDVGNSTLQVLGENPIGSKNYYFNLRSPMACRQGAPTSSTSPSPTSPSSSSTSGSTQTSVSTSGSTRTSVSTSGSTPTSISTSGSTPTSISTSGSTRTSVSTSGSTPTSASTSGSTRISVSTSGSTPTSISTSGSTPTSISTSGSTQTSVSTSGSTPTSISTSGSTQTSVSTSGSTPTSISTSGSTPTSVSTSGSTPTSVSTSVSTRTSVSTSGSTRTSVSTSGSTSSIVSTRSTTSSTTTSKPKKSKATATALVICAIILVIGLAVGLTIFVLRKKGKICQKEEYDNL